MKKIHISGVALIAMLVLSAVVASSALAVPEWLINGGVLAKEDKDEAKGGEELLFEYKSPLINFDVDCKVVLRGTVGVGAAGTITEVVLSECKLLEGIGPLEEEAVLKLHWRTEVTLVTEGVDLYRDLILSGGAGEPGWLMKLNGVDFVCEWEATKELFAEVVNEVGGFVDYAFHGNEAPTAKCSGGGTGKINGLLTQSVAGETLTVSG